MTNILEKIISHKEMEVRGLDAAALRRAAQSAPTPRDFRSARTGPRSGLPPALIAELKRASPSRGPLAPNLDLLRVAGLYAEHGACAVSVLTDQEFFHGTLEDLRELRYAQQFPLPLLRKDFILAASQIYESRLNGADAVLLIVAISTDDARLAGLHALALELGLAPVVEVHSEEEVERALKLSGVRLIGINNRDLASFEVRLETTERLRPMIPAHITVISKSLLAGAAAAQRL